MKQYLDSLRTVYDSTKVVRADRTGVGRLSVFGTMEKYDLADGFPLVTTREIAVEPLVKETLAFIAGSSHMGPDGLPSFWNKWAINDKDIDQYILAISQGETKIPEEQVQPLRDALAAKFKNEIGPLYGPMWRNAPVSTPKQIPNPRALADMPSDKVAQWTKDYEEWSHLAQQTDVSFEQFAQQKYHGTVDQLNELVYKLKHFPNSSRLCVTAWVPEYVPDESLSPQTNVFNGFGALASCHCFFQVFTRELESGRRALDLMVVIRSNDLPVGRPYNIAQYALLQAMLAQVVDMEQGVLTYVSGDAHIYANQVEYLGAKEGVETQLAREPRSLPKLWLNPEIKDIFAFKAEDIRIEGYTPHPPIKYKVAV